jgi:hypothetical protein
MRYHIFYVPGLVMTFTVRHAMDGPRRNRWFTVLNGGSFHGKL